MALWFVIAAILKRTHKERKEEMRGIPSAAHFGTSYASYIVSKTASTPPPPFYSVETPSESVGTENDVQASAVLLVLNAAPPASALAASPPPSRDDLTPTEIAAAPYAAAELLYDDSLTHSHPPPPLRARSTVDSLLTTSSSARTSKPPPTHPPPKKATSAAASAAVPNRASPSPSAGPDGPLANSDKVLPAGFPPAPDGIPLQQWADNYWFQVKGAPAPEGLPPAPPQLSVAQWASQWVFQRQQKQENAATGVGGFAQAPAPGTGAYAGTLTKTSLATYDEFAVCNDGSPGAFYYAPGTDSTSWLIYLEGGLWCWDQATCVMRASNGPQQISSTSWPDTMTQNGIFDTDASLNPFASANKVYVGYCSSDGWTGDSPAAETQAKYGFDFGFHGRRILQATIAALQKDFGMGEEGSKILLSGCSAGARGAMYNVDSVAAAMPTGVKVQALLDSSLWINVQPYLPTITSLADQCELALPLFNATGVLHPACVASVPVGSEYLCLMGQYLMPHILSPYFLYESQFDAFQLPYNMGGMPEVNNASQMEYANNWQSSLIAVIQNLPTPAQAATSGIFSLSCLRHCLTMGSAFWGAQVQTTSLASAASGWFYDGENDGSRIMATCYTYQRCVFC